MRSLFTFLIFMVSFLASRSGNAQYKMDTVLTGVNRVQFISSTEGFAYNDNACMTRFDVIYHTTDAGNTWRLMAKDHRLKAGNFNDMRNIYFQDSMTALMVTGNYDSALTYVYKTKDGGVSWQQKSASTLDLVNNYMSHFYMSIHFSSAKEGWVGGNTIVMHTSDGGETWTEQFNLPIRPLIGNRYLTVYSLSSKNVYIGGQGSQILHTLDGGANWTVQHIDTAIVRDYVIAHPDCYTIWDIKFEDSLHGYAAAWEGGYLETMDGGAHWTKKDMRLPFDTRGIELTKGNSVWMVGGPYCDNTGCYTNSTIFHSKNAGATWDTVLYRKEVYDPYAGGFIDIQFVNPALAFTGNSHSYLLRIKDTTVFPTLNVQTVTTGNNLISAYPNPANDKITVTCNEPLTGTGMITICNYLGEVLLSQPLTAVATELSVASYPAGMYICKVAVNGQVAIKKVIVTR